MNAPVKWKKLGLVIQPDRHYWWMQTHVMLPTPFYRGGSVIRVYFSGRNAANQSHIGYADVDFANGYQVICYSREPVLCPGELGCFDDCGVTPSCIIEADGEIYLYYIGWKQRSSVRFGLLPGLAVSRDNGATFHRISRAPILHRTDREPFGIMTAPCVIRDGALWRMWYVSCEGWIHADLPKYNIKYAESEDGINWSQSGRVCLDFDSEQETALARPCVIKENGAYQMWYSFKADSEFYRMGYAESRDGLGWVRMDHKAGIESSANGWDSEMIEYPGIIQYSEKKYMFYNGNGYGTEGAGLAVED